MAAPSTLTDGYDALLTTTLRNFQPRLRDNISRSNKLYAWLDGNGQVKGIDGGERVSIPLMYGLNSSGDIYSGYTYAVAI